jgi:hypothetical protein
MAVDVADELVQELTVAMTLGVYVFPDRVIGMVVDVVVRPLTLVTIGEPVSGVSVTL